MRRSILSLLMVCVLLFSCLSAAAAENTAVIPDIELTAKTIPDTEAQRFVDNLRLGYNLGNGFDANECHWVKNELDYESAWCGAKATPELFAALYAAGIRTVRIPVSWHNHVDKASYAISTPWLNRVQEVVDYALNCGMYVILNIHHDNNSNFLYPSMALREQSLSYVTAIWTQLSERFADYDEHLIFESMNEPRLVGHANEWYLSGNQDCNDAIAVINELNQAFVDTVRASGSQNATRYLIVPGYDASPDGALNKNFVIPSDPNTDNDTRIIIGVHAYTPYHFALEMPGTDKWSIDSMTDKADVSGFMNLLYDKFVSKGQPVIISEFGALRKNDNIQARTEFVSFYVACARARGMSCVWWDNNATSGNGELFGIIDRATATWQYPSLIEAMNRYAGE